MTVTDRLAVDIGGTFVDAVAVDGGEVRVEKAPTTPDDPVEGVLAAADGAAPDLGAARAFVHGTTLGVNALIERTGARTGIITNEGFRDVYEIGRTNLPAESMYDVRYEKPEPIVPRRRRVGVPGRIDADGGVVEPLGEDAVRAAADRLVEERGVEAIAICFLHAYRNPVHERRAADLVAGDHPEVSLSVSSDIVREHREYERTATAVLDAYVSPAIASYLGRLESALAGRGFEGSFHLTRSGGGALTADRARETPVHTLLSGPAGGLIGASRVGEATGRADLVAIDMGGTSLDACVVREGDPAVEHEAGIEGHPLMVPVYDLRTIGAGGGSVARVEGDLLKVGPRSAGADPGPICYGRGGREPTVTDAALALGYLDPERFLGGDLRLDAAAAREGIASRLAEPLGDSVEAASEGVVDVTLASTAGAIREITVERGLDPREFTLLAYGGAGPLFGPLIARELDAEAVLVPRAPAAFSAWGMLGADVIEDVARTHVAPLPDIDPDDLAARFDDLRAEALAALDGQDVPRPDRRAEASLEMRYRGQEHTVEVPAGDLDPGGLAERFERTHEARYGHRMDDPPEVVHLRVRAVGETDSPGLSRPPERAEGAEPVEERRAYCFAERASRTFPVYRREDLAPGVELDGPAVVREPTTTVVVHSDQRLAVDPFGHLVID